MFSYYGRKSKIVKHYPKPMFDKIIEPVLALRLTVCGIAEVVDFETQKLNNR